MMNRDVLFAITAFAMTTGICVTWHLNVVEQQATIREQTQLQRQMIDTARDASKSLDYWQKFFQQQNQSLHL